MTTELAAAYERIDELSNLLKRVHHVFAELRDTGLVECDPAVAIIEDALDPHKLVLS
jgi:hypothetical protein